MNMNDYMTVFTSPELTDDDCENVHWVCPVCFMPSENKNPLKKDLDNV